MLKIGDIVEGQVTGIQNYGIFVQVDEDTQGLVHISEVKHGYVSDLTDLVHLGDKLKVKVIDIDEFTHTVSLSLRAMQALNVPPFPARIRRRRRRHQPSIGFASLDKELPGWMDDAMAIIERDQFDIKQKV